MIDLKLAGRAGYLRLEGEIIRAEREQLEQIYDQITQSAVDVIIIDFTNCNLVDQHCVRSLVQVQAHIRGRDRGNVIVLGASSQLKEVLVNRGVLRIPETYESVAKAKMALAA